VVGITGVEKEVKMNECDICGEEHFLESLSCEACNKVVSKYQNDTRYSMKEVRKALKKSLFS